MILKKNFLKMRCTMLWYFFGRKKGILKDKLAHCNKEASVIRGDKNKLILLIRYMARDGMSEEEIEKRLGIKKSRLRSILKKEKGLSEELEYSRLLTDFEVEQALLKKALGGMSTEVKETQKAGGTERVTVTKEIPSDTTALQFWLKNRCPERWGEKASGENETARKLSQIMNDITLLARESVEGDEENEL